MSKKLSILICSIDSRSYYLENLMKIILPQITDDVEVIICKDNAETNISVKRNYVLRKALSDYICFVDDDDYVSKNYVDMIMKALQSDPDCCGIKGLFVNNHKVFINSSLCGKNDIQVKTYVNDELMRIEKSEYQLPKDSYYLRTPNHLCPVKREIANKSTFPINRYYGEDMVYIKKILPHIKTEVFIDDILYFYTCFEGLSEMSKEKIIEKKKKQVFNESYLKIIKF